MGAPADVRTYVIGDTGVATLIATRMYPTNLPQACTLPAVTYHVISRTHEPTLKGVAAAGTMRVQFDCWAKTGPAGGGRLIADAVGDAVVARLKTLAALGPTTIGSATKVNDVAIEGPRHESNPPPDGSDEWEYCCSLDGLFYLG
jgi:hypothetical protein